MSACAALASEAMLTEFVHGRTAHALVCDHKRRAEPKTDGDSQGVIVEVEAQRSDGDGAQLRPRIWRA